MQIPVTSGQFVFIPLYGPPGVDLTQFPVQVALVPETAGEPAPSAYQPGYWVKGQAMLPVASGSFPPGDYMAFAKVTAGLEAPVVLSGRVRIGDGVSPAGSPGAPAATWVTSVNGLTGEVVLDITGGGGAVESVNGKDGIVVLAAADVGAASASALAAETARAEGAEGANATAITAETTRAETAEGTLASGVSANATATAAETSRAETAEALLAPKASPALTGTPTGPTASALTSSTQLATTAYADSAVAAEVSRAETAEALKAPLASPALTGSPTAPTQTGTDSSTKLATTAFVAGAVGSETSRAQAAESTNATAVTAETSRAETAEAGLMSLMTRVLVTAAPGGTTHTAVAWEITAVDTTNGNATIKLPNGPAAGTLNAVKQIIMGTGFSVTVQCQGSDVINKAGGGTTQSLTLPSQGSLLHYSGTGIWTIISDDLPLSQLQSMFAQLANNLSDLASRQTALNNLTGAQSAGKYLRSDGTNTALAAIQGADLPAVAAFNPQSLLWGASCVASTAPPFVYEVSTFTPASGVLNVTAVIIPAGYPVNDIAFWTAATVAAGVTHGWYTILDSTGAVVAVTADQTAGSPWGTAKKAYKFATAATWTPAATALYYLGVMVVATTQPTMVVAGSPFSNAINTAAPSGAPVLYGSATATGLTTPPSIGTSYTISASGTSPLLAQAYSS